MGEMPLRSVRRALAVLRAFEDPPHVLGISDLARALGLSKGTVHLVVGVLEAEGFLEREGESGKYQLGPAIYRLTAAARHDLRLAAREPLRRLYAETSFPAYLAVLLDGRAVVVEKAGPTLTFLPVLDVGTPVPLHSSALGKALLAFRPEAEREALLERLAAAGLPATTPATITDPAGLREELRRIREEGLALDREESLPGVVCLAAPVRGATGETLAAVSVAAPAQALPEDDPARPRTVVAEMVRRTAASISYRLGLRDSESRFESRED
ncbi:MAG: IclR family transcriptional regulator [Firmicutes bacterium]|nr:IclR family transcriptional regulator [Bacillota bacterium]